MKIKICTKCKKQKPIKAFAKNKRYKDGLAYWCKLCRSVYNKEYIKSEEGKVVKRVTDRKYRESKKGRIVNKRSQKKYHVNLRSKMLKAYGGKCVLCGEFQVEYLQIDHINGKAEKDSEGRRIVGASLYSLLERLGYPREEHRLLCSNCNNCRRDRGDERAIELGRQKKRERKEYEKLKKEHDENKRRN